ncbi:hypothetical protein LU633_11540 [Erwinia tracheiphila]|uniref:Integrase n=1 Tax=Erwinia tracheiphila TaxID=65700 RepID=A0A345CQF8_9GAMM|nr:phage integrase [Erwinia tracheiphila]EOS93247.1 Phage integrase [Erwinia tracheiphila PSU-1]AXF75675.1 integrase [Erwinia tracheiphila]UIA81777.1 hypothetical protein LU604_13720 [Erwinia tracheiphila]UIA90372.1 hypothetical protein LU632_13285 [Erwinia tracheiphila]UIA98296.1 hypothetical protein LU633_11540 [Erwinia tracheiphila]
MSTHFFSKRGVAGKGKEFARKLPGHKTEAMTEKYLNTRGKEYVMI